MVLISSLYPVRDARSWPDKVHDAWLALGLALAGLAWCLAVPRGASRPLAWPWLALGLALGWPLAWPWLALGLALGWPGSNREIKLTGSPGKITGSGLLSIAQVYPLPFPVP